MFTPSLRDVLVRHELSPRKALGQNFILDTNLLDKIVRQAGNLSHANVIEIGPGPGGLTRAILSAGAAQVIAIEKDPRCLAALSELADQAEGRLQIIDADALTIDIAALGNAPRQIIANLPYNVATELLFRWLEVIHRDPSAIQAMTLMFQKEVADRITAAPNSKAYGRVSVMTQWLCETHAMFDIPPTAFVPPPKVMSTVIRIVPRPSPQFAADKTTLEKLLAAAFGQRRKMLRGSLKSLGVNAEGLLEKAGIDPTRRAETLSVEEFCRLSTFLHP